MSHVSERLIRYFLARLRRLQWLDLLEAATAASILEAIPLVQGSPEFGLSWKASERGIQLVHSILNSRTHQLRSGMAQDRMEALTAALSRALAPVWLLLTDFNCSAKLKFRRSIFTLRFQRGAGKGAVKARVP